MTPLSNTKIEDFIADLAQLYEQVYTIPTPDEVDCREYVNRFLGGFKRELAAHLGTEFYQVDYPTKNFEAPCPRAKAMIEDLLRMRGWQVNRWEITHAQIVPIKETVSR